MTTIFCCCLFLYNSSACALRSSHCVPYLSLAGVFGRVFRLIDYIFHGDIVIYGSQYRSNDFPKEQRIISQSLLAGRYRYVRVKRIKGPVSFEIVRINHILSADMKMAKEFFVRYTCERYIRRPKILSEVCVEK